MTTPLWKIRPAKAEDINFVLNSWLKRYRDAISARLVTDAVFYRIQHQVIRRILEQPGLVLNVACSNEDENQIFGYIVAEHNHIVPNLTFVHWVYVKSPLRKFGIAKALLETVKKPDTEQVFHHTHRTHLIEFIDREKKSVFNPTFIWSLI